jgi:hypothetical protein
MGLTNMCQTPLRPFCQQTGKCTTLSRVNTEEIRGSLSSIEGFPCVQLNIAFVDDEHEIVTNKSSSHLTLGFF